MSTDQIASTDGVQQHIANNISSQAKKNQRKHELVTPPCKYLAVITLIDLSLHFGIKAPNRGQEQLRVSMLNTGSRKNWLVFLPLNKFPI
jgi:hypothetical protein